MKSIESELAQVIEDFTVYEGTGDYIRPSLYDELEDEDVELTDVLDEVLRRHPDVKEFSVYNEDAFDSTGYGCGIVSVAYIMKNGKLGHNLYKWEVM